MVVQYQSSTDSNGNKLWGLGWATKHEHVVSPFIPLDTLQSAAADSTICILFTAKREYMCPSSVCTRHQSLWRQAQLVQGGSVIVIILSTCIRQMSEWRGASMAVCLERGADLHMAQLMPGHSPSPASVKSRLVLPFWYRLTWLVLDRGPLNGCVCVAHVSTMRLAPIRPWTGADDLNPLGLAVVETQNSDQF